MKQKQKEIQERINLYNKMRKYCDISKDNGVHLEMKISEKDNNKLRDLIVKYIAKSLRCSGEKINNINDFLHEKEEEILNLPNCTPNGAIFPKKENIEEYNNLQRHIINILKKINIIDNLIAIQPCIIRVKSGKKESLVSSRGRATTKIHSDSWASHYGDAILGMVVISENDGPGLNFYEPSYIDDTFFLPLRNYEDGVKKFKDEQFLGAARPGFINIIDHACLHKTIIGDDNKGLRLSIDFGIIVDDLKSLFFNTHDEKKKAENICDIEAGKIISMYTYMYKDSYSKIGDELFFSIEETLEESRLKYSAPEKQATELYDRGAIKIVENL